MMKSFALAGAIAMSGWLAGTASAHGCGHSYHHQGECRGCGGSGMGANSQTAPTAIKTIEGKIAEIVYLPGAGADKGMVELRISTAAGGELVRLAPAGFLKQHGLRLKEGDAVRIEAYPVAGMDGDLLVATEIRHGETKLTLRDLRGRPAW